MANENIIDSVEEVLRVFMRRLHGEVAHGPKSVGITGNRYWVLKSIYNNGRVMVSAVAEDLNVSLSAVTAMVDRLVDAGLVRRVRDETDRRVVWLGLTPYGEGIITECINTRRRVLEKYLGSLPEEDLVHLSRIFDKLMAVWKQEEDIEGRTPPI